MTTTRAQPGAKENESKPDVPVVGLGASAGGLSALKTFLEHTPADSGVAYVVVMHLSPEYESHLSEVLSKHADIPVSQVEKDTALEPNHVYVIPPNRNLSTIDSHLRLMPLEEARRDRAPIDHFFRALSQSHDGRGVAVLLSGSGSDGSIGLGQVKEAGGLTVAQEPSEAEFPSMPQSAVSAGYVDLVLPVRQVPGEVLRHLNAEPGLTVSNKGKVSDGNRENFAKLLALLHTRAGHDFVPYKQSTLLRRVSRRMQLRSVNDLAAYLKLLRNDEGELKNLYRDLLISVTSFFRDAEAFETLEHEVVPELLKEKAAGKSVRVWSVGCATGEEAYSLAMLLLEGVRDLERPVDVQVFASDASERALAKAREGLYPETIADSVSSERLKRFFTQPSGGGYQVSKELREHVVFAQHNLLTDPPFAKLDLVVCRNLLIYLKHEVQEEVLELFYYALQPGGYLFLGTSELSADGRRFRTLDKQQRLFQRQRVSSAEPRLPNFPLALPGNGQSRPAPPRPRNLSYGDFHARLAERHAPPSVLVTSTFEVVHRSETAGRFLQLPGGEPNDDLVRQVRSELRTELRSALHRAARQDDTKDAAESVTTRPVRVTLEGEPVEVALQVRPANEAEREGFLLVSFLELPAGAAGAALGTGIDESMAADLEQERQRLRTALQEHEGRDEEMRAANEELQSVNEELRATAEELETSKEELQSMNEELVTLNQENRHKVDELSQLNSDLQNLLSATGIATLFLDQDLRIRRFTPRVSDLFSVQNSDRGRPLADLAQKFSYPGLISDAREVLETLQHTERELQERGGGVVFDPHPALPHGGQSHRRGGHHLRRHLGAETRRSEIKKHNLAAHLSRAARARARRRGAARRGAAAPLFAAHAGAEP